MYSVPVALIEAAIGTIECILPTTVDLSSIKYIYYNIIYFFYILHYG